VFRPQFKKLSIFSIAIFLILPLVIAGCGSDEDDEGMDTGIVAPPPTQPPAGNQPPDDDNDPPLPPPPVEDPKVSFAKDIQPILNATCAVAGCHRGGGPTGGLNLETYANFKKGGNGGAAFVPKKGKSSLVVKRIDGGGMPRNRPPLKKDQIQLFIDWIDEGAEDN
jgi:hypothetical protein